MQPHDTHAHTRFQFAAALTQTSQRGAAIEELVTQMAQQLGKAPLDLLVVFLSPHFVSQAAQVVSSLRSALRPQVLIGCSSAGVIGPEEEVEAGAAISLLGARLPGVTLAPFALQPVIWEAVLETPQSFQESIKAPEGTKLLLTLADPFSTPMSELLEAANRFYPGLPLLGGLASASQRPGGNVLFANERCLKHGLVGVALAGDFHVDVVVSQGCRPVGELFTVTAAEDNVIFALDGESPMRCIQTLVSELSEMDQALMHNGLFVGRAIAEGESLGRGDFLVRGVVGADRESGAIAIGDMVQVGERVQFHLRDAETATEELELMLLSQAFLDAPQGALLFSCNGRGTHLYHHPNGDVRTIQNLLGHIPLAGFFCAGEIGPIGGINFLHGHTASMAIFRQGAEVPPEEA